MLNLKKSILVATALIVAPLTVAPTAVAQSSHKFESSVNTAIDSVRVEVKLSDDLAYRANNLSKDIRDRASSRSMNDGFAGAGYYGEKDLERLTERLQEKTEAQLQKSGITVSDNAQTVLTVTLADARPNRPTFKQLSKSTGLSMQSFGLGGAEFEATITRAGQNLGSISYAWFESNIDNAYASGTWSDARRAINLFAKKTAKSLASQASN